MKTFSRVAFLVLLFHGVLLSTACRRASAPPAPLPMEEVPAQIQKAFASAAPGARDIAAQVAQAVKGKDYPGAYEGVQILTSLHDATPEQRDIATRSMLSLTALLRDLQAKGDPAAAAALQAHKVSK